MMMIILYLRVHYENNQYLVVCPSLCIDVNRGFYKLFISAKAGILEDWFDSPMKLLKLKILALDFVDK